MLCCYSCYFHVYFCKEIYTFIHHYNIKMVNKCVYCGEPQIAESGRSFHKFPFNDIPLMEKWLENINVGPLFKPSRLSRLCSDHFEEKCLSKYNKGKLLPGSIPTKFGLYKSSCIYCHAIKGANKNRSFRKFPFGNVDLLQQWLIAMDLKDVVVTERSLLCSDHFDEKCFRRTGRNSSVLTLKSDALPSLFVRNKVVDQTHNSEKNVYQKENNNYVHKKREASPSNLLITKKVKLVSFGNNEVSNKVSFSTEKDTPPVEDNFIGEPSTSLTSEQPPPETIRPGTPIAERCRRIYEDHPYDSTPRTLRSKLKKNYFLISTLRHESRIQKQKIKRLEQRVKSLTQLVGEIQKRNSAPHSRLKLLKAIRENDV